MRPFLAHGGPEGFSRAVPSRVDAEPPPDTAGVGGGEVAVPGVLHSPAGWCFAEVLLGRPVVAEHDGDIQAGGVHGSELRRTVLVEVGGQDVLADHLRADAREDGRAEAGHSLPPRLAVPGFLDDVAVRVDPHGFERLTTG